MAAVIRRGQFLEIRHQDEQGHLETDAHRYADLYDFAHRLKGHRSDQR
jgi:hypothetical protein